MSQLAKLLNYSGSQSVQKKERKKKTSDWLQTDRLTAFGEVAEVRGYCIKVEIQWFKVAKARYKFTEQKTFNVIVDTGVVIMGVAKTMTSWRVVADKILEEGGEKKLLVTLV